MHLIVAVGLRQERDVLRQVAHLRLDMARDHDDQDRRPPVADRASEFHPVHGPGHLQVRDDHAYVVPAFQDGDGLVGVSRFQNLETSVLYGADALYHEDRFVLGDQRDWH